MRRIPNTFRRAMLLCIALILTTAIFPLGCSKTKPESKEINIGVVLPLTGSSASHGKDALNGFEMAREEINSRRQPSQPKLELLVEDSLSSPQGGVSAIQKLIQTKKVSVVIGPVASSEMLAMIPIAEREKVVLFSPYASSPEIADAGDYIFRISLLAPPQTRALAEYAINVRNMNKAAILYINNDTGQSYKKAFTEAYSKLGGTIVFEDSYEGTSVDYRIQLTKAKNAQPQIVFVPGAPRATGLILRQAKELGLECQFLGNYGAEGDDLFTTGGDAVEGFIYASIPISDEFTRPFIEKNGHAPAVGIPLGYDAVNIIWKIVTEYGPTSDSIRSGLTKLKDYKGATGNTSMSDSGDADKEVCLKIVKNGTFVILSGGIK